ncbi:MAG: transposase zinc-binding domain-containing protein, partial [Acidobacteria bacterium]|nr:transposase zinc-binding domain-containing protein [Acidobacteriota bacterium]
MLYQVVRDHVETFRAQAASLRDGEGLPGFVEREFRDFLRCGWLAGGFARLHCDACGLDRLVPFSCKGRGFCPSCGGRRMAERAAHLVDHVFPVVPVRQWVLSLPHRLRYVLAWDHALCRAVTGVFVCAVLGSLRRRARQQGAPAGRGGASAELLALAPQGLGPCHARRNGIDLHAGVVVPPRDRARLERLCR